MGSGDGKATQRIVRRGPTTLKLSRDWHVPVHYYMPGEEDPKRTAPDQMMWVEGDDGEPARAFIDLGDLPTT